DLRGWSLFISSAMALGCKNQHRSNKQRPTPQVVRLLGPKTNTAQTKKTGLAPRSNPRRSGPPAINNTATGPPITDAQ
ncbi:hypothetical protein, partial [Cupriavidus sp. 8B]